jgi:transcription-repair coupling factor (superfamily II helicase)
MALDLITHKIAETSKDFFAALNSGQSLPSLGLRRSARLPLLAVLYRELHKPILLLTDRTDHALALADELSMWLPEAPRLFFPEPTPLFYENAPWGLTTRRDRLMVLTTLAAYHIPGTPDPEQHPILIAPVRAIMTRTLPRREFLKALRSLKPGQIVQPDELARTWVSLGYENVNTVVAPGQFARRGGILDIWTPADSQPVRIEFFGDEIDTLRRFDPATQRTITSIERLPVSPAREYLTPSSSSPVDGASLSDPLLPTDSPLSEFYIPILHPTPASLLDYLPRDEHNSTLVLVDDTQAVRDTAMEIEEQAAGLRRDYVQDGELPESFPTPYLSWSEIEDTLAGKQTIDLGYSIEPDEAILAPAIAARFAPGPRFGGRLKPVMEHLTELTSRNEIIVIVSRQSARLQELWVENTPEPSNLPPTLLFLDASLAEGFTYTPPDAPPIHLLTDGEIFGWRRPELRPHYRPVAEAPESAYADLEPNDWVVHIDHGIGRFVGLVDRTVDGI